MDEVFCRRVLETYPQGISSFRHCLRTDRRFFQFCDHAFKFPIETAFFFTGHSRLIAFMGIRQIHRKGHQIHEHEKDSRLVGKILKNLFPEIFRLTEILQQSVCTLFRLILRTDGIQVHLDDPGIIIGRKHCLIMNPIQLLHLFPGQRGFPKVSQIDPHHFRIGISLQPAFQLMPFQKAP